MAGLLDLFSGGGSADLYGDMLSERQRGALGNRGLLALAASLGKNAGPSFSPVPDFGAALGMAAGAYGTGSDAAAENVFTALLRSQQAEDLRTKAKARAAFMDILSRSGAAGGGAVPATPGTAPQGTANLPSIQGPLAVPTGGAPRGLGGLLLPEIKSTDLGGDDSGTSRFPDLGIEYPATDPSGLKAGGALRRTQTAATPAISADLAPYQTGGLLAPQPAELPQLANYAAGNAVPGGASPITGVAPQMSNRLEAMLAGMPPDVLQKFNVLSGYRSPERQAVVNPGVTNSRHTAGTAVDTTTDPAVLDWVRQNGPQYGVGYTLAGMPGEENHLEMLGEGGGRAPIQIAGRDTVVPSGGGLPVQNAALTGSAREIADNNFGGMRRPGVIATPGQGGFQAFATPAEGLAAISRQLDRYASGATTGKPLTTIRQIVSTWAPPSENDTERLIKDAAKVIDPSVDVNNKAALERVVNTPLDVSNPAVKAKLIEATIRNEQGGRLPVPADLINQVAAAPGAVTGGPDTVVPTGDRPSLPVQRTQYAPAQGGLLAAPAAPGGPGLLTPQGKIPGFNLTPAEAARADALAEIAGLGNPFKSILESYYKSPDYLREAAGAGEAGKLPYVGPAETARQTAAEPFKIREQERELKNALIKEGWQLDDKGNAIPVPLYNDIAAAKANAISTAQEGPKLDSALAQQNRMRVYDAQGHVMIVPIPGGAGTDAAAAAAKAGAEEAARIRAQLGGKPELERETETQKGFAAQDTSARAQALAAREGLFLLGDARQQLEGAGIFSGALANPKMTLAQYYSSLTGVPNEQLVNTQVFLQQAGARSAAILQAGTYGTGTAIGKTDLDAANRLANGDNTVSLEAIKRVFDLTEKTAHRKIEMFNDMIRKRDPNSVIEPPSRSVSAGTAGALDFSKMSPQDLAAAVTRGDLTMDQRRAIDQRFRELGH